MVFYDSATVGSRAVFRLISAILHYELYLICQFERGSYQPGA